MHNSQRPVSLTSLTSGSESGDEVGGSLGVGLRKIWRFRAIGICGFVLFGSVAVLSYGTYLGLTLLSDAGAFLAAPELFFPMQEQRQQRPDACPCECQEGANDEAQSPPQAESCRVGDRCLFGQGWCSRVAPLSAQTAQPQLGSCLKQKCGGPTTMNVQSTCSRANQIPFDVSAFLQGFSEAVKQRLQGAQFVNKLLATFLQEQGLELNVTVDEALIEDMSVQLSHLSVEWLLGCYPASRYAIASGSVNLPRGAITVNWPVDGFKIDLLPSLLLTFRDLRIDLSCPGGIFVAEGFGHGKSGAVEAKSIVTEGGLSILCAGGWGLYCGVTRALVPVIVSHIPQLTLSVLAAFRGYNIAPGCGRFFRNTFGVLSYHDKECCEGAYQVDHSGCFIGGQLNVGGIKCKLRSDTGSYTADCLSVPGTYVESTPGICHEAAQAPEWSPEGPGVNFKAVFSDVRRLLRVEGFICLALVLLVLSLSFVAVLCLLPSDGYEAL
eukprot:TRINITY_DN98410_c0_g1_i1.p1 TRINITY_DN98410_c0_g1~~TRINITY_DN98410_c0_g1_i1.p1  ORF type:complete len:494 (+),score=61.94 TRINITY_DN98410_c0_g1_i1:49-1530(+)